MQGSLVPHNREDLHHQVQILLNLPFFDLFSFCCKHFCPELEGKEQKKWDGVTNAGQVGWGAQPAAKCGPLAPGGGIHGPAAESDASSNLIPNKDV
eukprot:10022906-Ditylum_brightwellii.AAC.1